MFIEIFKPVMVVALFILLMVLSLAVPALVGYTIWHYALGYLYSLIPDTAVYAWAGKLMAIAIVASCGGLSIPFHTFRFMIAVIDLIVNSARGEQ